MVLLAKRHGQLKEAVVRMIDTTITFLAEIKQKGSQKDWLELLETLRTVTEGKVSKLTHKVAHPTDASSQAVELTTPLLPDSLRQIYLELPRARLTTLLSRHHEKLAETAPAPTPEGT